MPTIEPPAAAGAAARIDDVMRRLTAAREVARVPDTEPEWWQLLYELAASLDPELLVYYVAGMARMVQAGDTSVVDELTVACRVLQRRYETTSRIYPAIRGECPRLADRFADKPNKPAQRQVDEYVLRRCNQFASATYAQVDGWFVHWGPTLNDRIATSAMAIFPDAEPQDGNTRVVLYGTLNAGPGPLLYNAADSPKWNEAITHLLGRVVGRQPFPWERDGWNGD